MPELYKSGSEEIIAALQVNHNLRVAYCAHGIIEYSAQATGGQRRKVWKTNQRRVCNGQRATAIELC